MLRKKVFIGHDDSFTLLCPECLEITLVDASRYKTVDRAAKIKYECACGYIYNILLERRKYYRKETHLPGICISDKNKRPMAVKDLSLVGLKFETESKQHGIVVEDELFVEFCLDDEQKTLIRKKVVVKIVSDFFIGAEFCSSEPEDASDKAIQFYLIP